MEGLSMLDTISSVKEELTAWRQRLWHQGEMIVSADLQRQGWKILERNWHASKFGEIDIVARDAQGMLVFVEVKARLDRLEPGINQAGFEAIGSAKKRKLMKSAQHYLRLNRRSETNYRFDVVIVNFKPRDGLKWSDSQGLRNASTLYEYEILHIKQAFSG
jgi:putative endonuclease